MENKMRSLPLMTVVTLIAGMTAAYFFREVSEVEWLREEFFTPGECVTVSRSEVPEKISKPVINMKRVPESVSGERESGAKESIGSKEVPAAGKNNSFMQIQYLPWSRAYLQPAAKSINGLALGYYMPQKEINGLSLAMVHMFNQKKSGLSFSLVDVSNISNGFSLFFVGGAVDNRGCLVGAWNITESNNGIQIGIFNHTESNSLVEYSMKPEKSGKEFGVQAGLINVSDAPGIQFGLWNINPNSIIKHFPLINICF